MLSKLLHYKGNALAAKASQRVRWWSSRKWASVIVIDPKLTEANPLWCRSNESLSSTRLFGLTTEKLQQKIENYWQKPSWRQWLEYWLSPIQQELEAWSYYQQCLAFREIQQQNPPKLNLPLAISFTLSQRLIQKLAPWLSKIDLKFESYISNHSPHWIQKHFEFQLRKHEKQRNEKFTTQLKKELKELQIDAGVEINKEINQAYEEAEEIMHSYYLRWRHRAINSKVPPSSISFTERNLIPLANSSTILPISPVAPQPSTSIAVTNSSEKGLSSRNFTKWINERREEIIQCLDEKNEHRIKQAQNLLDENLQLLTDFLAPQLECYKNTVKEALLDKFKHQTAIEVTQNLQSRLIKYYRQGSLLFHPDRNQDLLQPQSALAAYWNKIFLTYRQHWDYTSKELETWQSRLKDYIDKNSAYYKEINELIDLYKDLNKRLDEMALQRKNFHDEMDILLKEMKAIKESCEQLLVEIEEGKLEIKETSIQQTKKLDEMNRQLDFIFTILPSEEKQLAEPQPANEEDQANQVKLSISLGN